MTASIRASAQKPPPFLMKPVDAALVSVAATVDCRVLMSKCLAAVVDVELPVNVNDVLVRVKVVLVKVVLVVVHDVVVAPSTTHKFAPVHWT